ncbi:MAG: response regulator [Planctomycetes bacterium]|nr:response regulator [Planctomycetota bacterium]
MESARILVIDDDPFVRELIAEMLSAGLHEVRVASSEEEGLRLFEEQRPDLILLDVDLGRGRSGFDVCRNLMARPDPPPVIFLTSHAEADYVREGTEAGAQGYLTKPFSPLELIEKIQAVRSGP